MTCALRFLDDALRVLAAIVRVIAQSKVNTTHNTSHVVHGASPVKPVQQLPHRLLAVSESFVDQAVREHQEKLLVMLLLMMMMMLRMAALMSLLLLTAAESLPR